MITTKILLILPLVVAVLGQETRGIEYYGTSNVRDQRLRPRPLYRPRPMLPGRPVSLQPVVAAPSVSVASAATAAPAVNADTAAAPATPEVPAVAALATPTNGPVVLHNPGSRPPIYSPVYRPPLPPRPIRPVIPPTAAPQPAGPVAVVPETPVAAAPQSPVTPVQVTHPAVENVEPPAPESPVLELAGPVQPEPDYLPVESFEPEPVEVPPAPTLYPQPEEPVKPAEVPGPEIVAEPIPEPEPTPEPAPISERPLAPEPTKPSVVEAPELAQASETVTSSELVQTPETVQQPELVQESETIPQPEPSLVDPIREREPLPVVGFVSTAPEPGALLPLLPKPKPIRKPAFGRHPQHPTPPIIYYPTPSYVTHSMATLTEAPPVVITTQSHPTVTRPTGTLKIDFQCKEENGYYPVANECDTYIECRQGRAMKYWCPDGLHFNLATKHFEYPCAYPSEVKCTAGAEEQNPNPTAHCPNQYGFYSMNDDDCSKFIMCHEGLATIIDCPMGLVFNPLTSSCDWPANVPQCNPKVFKDFTCPEAPLDEDGQISDIIYNYRYGQDCKLYIACQRAHPRLLSCDRGLSFDDESQACIDEDYVTDCMVGYQAPV